MNRYPLSLAALTVLELSPADMVETAARAEFDRVGLRLVPATPEEVSYPILDDPALLKATLKRIRDTGMKVADIEILRLTPETDVARDFTRFIEVGAELGASEILVAGNDDDPTRLTDNFANLCELSAPAGLNPHLEFMPWTAVKDLLQARRIVEAVRAGGHANACLLVDAFHLDRSGSRLEDLARIPREWMRYVQLCDVPGPVPDSMDEIIRQARGERGFPGDGHADLQGLLATIADDMPLSIEVPTEGLYRQGVTALDRAIRARNAALELM